MKHFLNIVLLSASLVGCVHEVDRAVVTETSFVNDEPNCRQQHRFCRENCLKKHAYNTLNRDRCFDVCEYRLTSCLNASSMIVRRESPVIVDPYVPVINPYPHVFVDSYPYPYPYWGGRYYHPSFHGYRHR